jgi:hypothetical protein
VPGDVGLAVVVAAGAEVSSGVGSAVVGEGVPAGPDTSTIGGGT